ncbi:MAG: hypothetical protein AB9834_13905 [Lentimicrobium sp.]
MQPATEQSELTISKSKIKNPNRSEAPAPQTFAGEFAVGKSATNRWELTEGNPQPTEGSSAKLIRNRPKGAQRS